MADLSIIIVSYNTEEMTTRCLQTLLKSLQSEKSSVEVIVVDNASSDSTAKKLELLQKEYKKNDIQLTIILNSKNLGYSKANNKGAAVSSGRYLLFLNSDVLVGGISFEDLINKMDNDPKTGAMTVKVLLPDKTLDPASHRGFPTVWRSFSYFTGLENLFGKIPGINRLFGGYHLTFLNLNKSHEIDSATGAFYLVRKDVFEQVKGFDESFFMYGEDIDLSFSIKKLGYKILYDPQYTVLHLKYQSGIKSKDTAIQSKTKSYFYDAMRIFYDKHYAKTNSAFVNKLVHNVINRKAKKA